MFQKYAQKQVTQQFFFIFSSFESLENSKKAYWTYYVPQTVAAPTPVAATHVTSNNSGDQKKSMKSSEYHSGASAMTFSRIHHFAEDADRSSSGDSNVTKSHSTSTHPNQHQQHSNTAASTSVKTPLYTPSPSSDKTLTNSSSVSQTNVFQYPPPAMTSSSTTSSSMAITNATTTNSTNNTSAVTTPIQSIPNTPVSTTAPSIGSDNSKLVSHNINIGQSHSSHASNSNVSSSSSSSTHLIHNTKNHQALFIAPNENAKNSNNSNNNANNSSSNINPDEQTYHEPKEYSNHSSGNYERKKNQQNPNRKPSGAYRPNVGINSQNSANSLSATNNHQSLQSSTSTPNASIRKGPLIHQIAESSGHNHIYTSGAGHHHNENTQFTYHRANSSQINSK